MRYIIYLFPLLLIGCANMPPMFMAHDNAKDKTKTTTEAVESQEVSRQALEVPPELRGTLSVPMPDHIASEPEEKVIQRIEKEIASPTILTTKESKETVSGKHITLDTQMYSQSASQVFSATIDAMTALNLPVQSVDSPSGIITTDWVKQNANSMNAAVSTMIGGGANAVRYRYVVRVMKNEQGQTLLQVRNLGQVFMNRHWVNRQLTRKVTTELFSAIEERL